MSKIMNFQDNVFFVGRPNKPKINFQKIKN